MIFRSLARAFIPQSKINTLLLCTVAAIYCVFLLFAPVNAQQSFTRQGLAIPYAWGAGDLALAYPAAWEAPVPAEEDQRIVLRMAQTQVNDPQTRSPGIPFITMAIVATDNPDADLSAFLDATLDGIGIIPDEHGTALVAGSGAIEASGSSADGSLSGIGRAAHLPNNRAIIISGRALTASHDPFLQTFDAVSGSIVLGAGSTPPTPTFGVLWYISPLQSPDGALSNLGPLTVSGNYLYAIDTVVPGIAQIDIRSGIVAAMFTDPRLIAPSDIASAPDGTLYIADTVCRCVLTLNSDGEIGQASDPAAFGESSPRSVAVTHDGTLYATDQTIAGLTVRAFPRSGAERTIPLELDQVAQPLLAADQTGRLLELTPDGRLFALDSQSGTLQRLFHLQDTPNEISDFAVDKGNNLLLATDNRGIVIINLSGAQLDRLGRIVANFPLAGEIVHPRGVAVDTDDVIYWADSDGTFGAITAMGIRPAIEQISAGRLSTGEAAIGLLNTLTSEQVWTFDGTAGQNVTITAIDATPPFTYRFEPLDVAISLRDPSGREIASNDDHVGYDVMGDYDAQIAGISLPQSGIYQVVVESVKGSGTYRIGVSGPPQTFELSSDGITRLEGELSEVFPAQQWTFTGQAGQTLTLTMTAVTDGLDPFLRLYDAEGNLLARNDDAADIALGSDAQIAQLTLPADGVYLIEAARFEGVGQYEMIIVEFQR
jgi:streptogramin lyase